MTVQELIDKLNKVEDKTVAVFISPFTGSPKTITEVATVPITEQVMLRDWEEAKTV